MDIWREISLLLPYHHLAVNREFLKLYNDLWFQDKINRKHSSYKKNHDWKLLYKWSLQSGIFIHRRSNIEHPIEGIKIATKERYCQLILTFDRTLYFYNIITKDLIMLDENVSDVCNNYYIKEQEWYECEFENKLVTKADEKFLMVVTSDLDDCAAITGNIFYYWCLYDNELISIENKGIIKLIYNGFYIIQNADGIIKRFDYETRSLIPLPLPKVRDLYPACVQLMNGNIMVIYDKLVENRYLFQSRKIDIKGKVQEAIVLRDNRYETEGMLLLLDNDLYLFNKKLKLIRKDVKNLFDSNYYMIEK